MIYVKYYTKSNPCFLEDINRKLSAEIEKIINNPDASVGVCCSHKVVAVGFNTLCYDAERRGIKPSARISCDADIIYQSPHANKIIWASKRLDENYVCIMVFDKAANKIASIKMGDELSDSDIAFTSLNEDYRIVVSFAAGQDGSQDYCIELNNNELKIIYKFPKNLSYMCSFDKYALLADFYSSFFF